ncbi:hypothetical protein CEXT_175681 [Caerostris extrusa]|uniref:Uncharacterized protein n=1 Tax=Caerostris extrusa TaxID=172846 RepID=A0AAV4MCU7_CAEEX|nr:hypothetical protein CEXT_175681 [Caerostris extrusa]
MRAGHKDHHQIHVVGCMGPICPSPVHLPNSPLGLHGPAHSRGKAKTDWKAIDLGQPQYVNLPRAQGRGPHAPFHRDPRMGKGEGEVSMYQALVGI